MEFSGEYRVPAAPERVWDALVDPEVLRACVPGCESVEKTGEWSYRASCKLRMGPVSLNMAGELRLEDVDAPRGCKIVGEGRDRSAGHAKGEATVTISPDENSDGSGPNGSGGVGGVGAVVKYTARAVVGGRIAQLGGRLIDAAVKKYADEFFGKFAAHLGGGQAEPARTESDSARAGPDENGGNRIRMAWFVGGALALILLLLWLSGGAE